MADLRTLEAQVRQRNADLMNWLRGDNLRARASQASLGGVNAVDAENTAQPALLNNRSFIDLCAQV